MLVVADTGPSFVAVVVAAELLAVGVVEAVEVGVVVVVVQDEVVLNGHSASLEQRLKAVVVDGMAFVEAAQIDVVAVVAAVAAAGIEIAEDCYITGSILD
ncbi:hypothetical protein QCA50_009348 [Cerrena zonata]|uniref:Secreted protein n=1 Tax=Cerrena zonata TaxID=2478898 RepID=A0AAW0GC26_9APHY